MENCKGERAKGLKWSSSDNKEEYSMDSKCNGGAGGGSEEEEGYIFRLPLNTNGISSRKRVKLQGKKVPEVRGPVDPALVPRRLRSAMNKRISQSASPPLSDSKRKQQHTSNGTPLFTSTSAERFEQNMLDKVTKDEEEVAEALTSMASLFTISKPVKTKEDGRMLEENSETKAPPASPLECITPKEEGTKFLAACNGTTATDPSPCVEDSPETMKAYPSTMVQPTVTSVSQKFNADENRSPPPDSLRKHSSNMESVEGVTHLRDAINVSNPLGPSHQNFPGNGMLQPSQLDALLVQKQELELWPLGPASLERDLQSLKQKSEFVLHDLSLKAPDVKLGMHSTGPEQLTMPCLSKAATYPNSVPAPKRPCRTHCLPTEKLSLMSADKKRPWNKCPTHVYICHLILNYQKAEKKQPSMPQGNQSKAKEGTNCSVATSGETGATRNGVIPPPTSASQIERSMLEVRILQDGRLLQAQQAVAFPAAYAPPQQGSDLLSLLASGDTKFSRNAMKSSDQLHVPYPPNQVLMPITFPRGSYTSQHQEQLATGAAQQVQLQLPRYIASSQLYGPHMGQAAGSTTKQQQQHHQLMWQTHLPQYKPPVGFPSKWQQNGWQHDTSLSPLISQSPSIFPFPADYNPQNLHQPFILPMPSPSSSISSRSKQKQQHNGGGLSPQSSSQLQMICNADSYR